MPLNLLTKSKFFAKTGVQAEDINDTYLESAIEDTNAIIEAQLGSLFALTPATTLEYTFKSSPRIVPVGTWQKTGLVVKVGRQGSSSLTTLTEGVDYTFFYTENSIPDPVGTKVVIGVRLVSRRLDSLDFLQLTGTYGYSAEVPADYNLAKVLYPKIAEMCYASKIQSETGGYGAITDAGIGKVKVTFGEGSSVKTPAELEGEIAQLIFEVKRNFDFSDMLPMSIG
jgi:hypothetical protein